MAERSLPEESIFAKALEIKSVEDRTAFLDLHCGDNHALRAEVEALLLANQRSGDLLDLPEEPAVSPTLAQPLPILPGTMIGHYKLLQQIGEGGMGVVYMAEQTQPVHRKVALKIIKPGMDSRQVIARFEAERQALAMMDHVNIARVIDGGTISSPLSPPGRGAGGEGISPEPGGVSPRSGRPYFVMELIHGIPITKYCDDNHLTPRERLELFVPVCQAVQHAHQKGIIHRDIKPSNVLVTLYDGKPIPKIIDFGVAKAIDQKLTDNTLFTNFGTMVGTLEYMSPEQAEMSNLGIDTRSDIYSLGVLLYELLTGSTPLSRQQMKHAAYAEILRRIKDEEPPKPSTRLSNSGDALASISALRKTEPSKLSKLMRGELDWIVMKTLEKDRNRRYESANGLAVDVQHYLADEPVQACPPSAAYRIKKFARRNKRALVTAALMSATLLIMAGNLGWIARDRAAQRGRNAEAVADLIDQCEDALRTDGADRASIALEAAERRAADGGADALADRCARCRADLQLLRDLDAVDIFHWTWTEDRRSHRKDLAARWRAALTAYGVTPEVGRPEAAAERLNRSLIRDRVLSALDSWLALAEASAWVRAILRSIDPDPYRDAVRDAFASQNAKVATALVGQREALSQPARFAAVLGQVSNVVPSNRRAVLEQALKTRPGDLALLMAMGNSYPVGEKESVSERLRWFQAAVAAHPNNVAARNNLGTALYDRGELDAAFTTFLEAIRLEPMFARGHYHRGVILRDKKQPEPARMAFLEAIRLEPNYAPAHYEIAHELHADGRIDEALEAYRKAIKADPMHDGAHNNVGAILCDVKLDFDGAIKHFQEAIRLAPLSALHHRNLGDALRKKQDLDAALLAYKEAIRLDAKHAPAHHHMGLTLIALSNIDGAIVSYHQAIKADPDSFTAHFELGLLLMQSKHDYSGAVTQFNEAVRLKPNVAEAHCNLGNARLGNGDRDGAIKAFREAIRLDKNLVNSHFNLGTVLLDIGDPTGAVACFREALRLNPKDAEARSNLGVASERMGDFRAAIEQYLRAIETNRKFSQPHNNLAWLYATGPDTVREGKKAVEHAMRACELTGWKDPVAINTLAAAHAQSGDFDRAIEFQTKALSFPEFEKTDGKSGRQRLDLYQRKLPYRNTATSTKD